MPAAHAFAADVVELRLQRDYLDFSTPPTHSPLYSYHESMATDRYSLLDDEVKQQKLSLYNAHA